jgi:hypothetical protein
LMLVVVVGGNIPWIAGKVVIFFIFQLTVAQVWAVVFGPSQRTEQ